VAVVRRPVLVLALTDPRSALLVRGQVTFLREAGFDVHLVTGHGEPAGSLATAEGATHHPIDIARDLAPARDLRALAAMTGLLRRLRPDLIDGSTPKAGLLAMVAAAAVRVPGRVHTLRGLRFETVTGVRRRLLWAGHRVTCDLAHRVICVGPGLRARAVELGVVAPGRAVVLGPGSGNGVDLTYFAAGAEADAEGATLRAACAIPTGAPVVAFVGRLARDKGLATLAASWPDLRARGAHLVIAGADDPTDPVEAEARAALAGDATVHMLGERPSVRAVYALATVVVLPSYREGFANVLLEAAAMSRPAVASDIAGCRDVIADQVSGALVAPRAPAALAAVVAGYLADPARCARHGAAGRARVERDFSQAQVWARIAAAYHQVLAERGAG